MLKKKKKLYTSFFKFVTWPSPMGSPPIKFSLQGALKSNDDFIKVSMGHMERDYTSQCIAFI